MTRLVLRGAIGRNLKAMTAACYAPDNQNYPPVAFLFNLLFQRMKVLS